MSKQIVIDLPDEVYRRAEGLARITRRDVADVLADAITLSLPSLADSNAQTMSMTALSNDDVLALSRLELPPAQDKRLSTLLDRQQGNALADAERTELQVLMRVYQERLLQKAEAIEEAVRRGLLRPQRA